MKSALVTTVTFVATAALGRVVNVHPTPTILATSHLVANGAAYTHIKTSRNAPDVLVSLDNRGSSNISVSDIVARAEVADDETWKKYADKGGALMCAMRGDDKTAGELLKDPRNPPSAQSVWKGDLKEALKKWYWSDVDAKEDRNCDFEGFWRLRGAFQDLKLNAKPSSKGGDNTCYRIEHQDPSKKDDNGNLIKPADQKYNVDGKEYRATDAHYAFGVNRKGGAIMGLAFDGPKSAAKDTWSRDPGKDELPALRSFSDVLWGFWNRDNEDIINIRYYMVHRVVNNDATKLIARALKNRNAQLTAWPGQSFATDTDEGHAILGSPIGATIAYFLIQHKAELGDKFVKKVTVMSDEKGGSNPHVVFQIGNKPDPSLPENPDDIPDIPDWIWEPPMTVEPPRL